MRAFREAEDIDLTRTMPPQDLGVPDQEPLIAEAGQLPNFLIIGAARSGTTTLHYVLGQHPQIYMSPNKETNFFSYYHCAGEVPGFIRREDRRSVDSRSVKSLDEYKRLFRGVTREIAVGETSPSYLLTPGLAETIQRFVPDAKIIAVLRQPIDKAYSHFLRKCRTNIYSFTTDFGQVLEQDEERIERDGRGTSFLGHGRYTERLKRYYDVFGPDRVKVCLFEDMESRPHEFYADLFQFLGVDASFQPDVSTKFNQSGEHKSSTLARFTRIGMPWKGHIRRNLPPAVVTRLSRWRHKVQSANTERPPELPAELRRQLTRRYCADDIASLQKLIGRDLSHWLE
ncbi:MAG: sulfotransferase [Kiloniellales bacterium]